MFHKSFPRAVGPIATMDNLMTYDAARRGHNGGPPLESDYVADSAGRLNAIGRRWGQQFRMPDYYTPDGELVGNRFFDSAGAFLVGELERLDYTLHEPLVDIQYPRDIDLREDVTIGDEVSSFTSSSFASAGGAGDGQAIGNGKAWVGRNTTEISGVGVDIDKTPQPLRPWGLEIKYTLLELESSARIGRPIDAQKYKVLQLKHQMDIDEQVYYGDTVNGDTGLVNAAAVTPTNLANGALGSPKWTMKTPNEILADVNGALNTNWSNAAWAVLPNRVLIPPAQYAYIANQLVSAAGNTSILTYLLENNIVTKQGGQLEILPTKWCIGAGVGGVIGTPGTDRMVVYRKEYDRVRYPMTLLQRTPIQYEGIYLKTTYYGRLGVLEVVYTQTIGYYDGL